MKRFIVGGALALVLGVAACGGTAASHPGQANPGGAKHGTPAPAYPPTASQLLVRDGYGTGTKPDTRAPGSSSAAAGSNSSGTMEMVVEVYPTTAQATSSRQAIQARQALGEWTGISVYQGGSIVTLVGSPQSWTMIHQVRHGPNAPYCYRVNLPAVQNPVNGITTIPHETVCTTGR